MPVHPAPALRYRRAVSDTVPSAPAEGPWNPGLKSEIPKDLRPLSTLLRPQNVFTSVASAEELIGLTGSTLGELVRFRPERLALHEVLIRVTANFVVPDGPRIEDLGIAFRRMASRLMTGYVEPRRDHLLEIYEEVRGRTLASAGRVLAMHVPALETAGADDAAAGRPAVRSRPARGRRGWRRLMPRRAAAPAPAPMRGVRPLSWGPDEIQACTAAAVRASDPLERLVHQALARVLAALFAVHGQAWGTRELILELTGTRVLNELASESIGAALEPLLAQAAQEEGYGLLSPQAEPIVINTKGPSASGKSTLRPLQKRLVAEIGAEWSEFALISPDIWRKQLLDYGSLGAAYKYAGALTADELAIVDHKLDRYMARKYRNGGMTHLLIDRFRFDSFAPDSDEAGSNLLTRFGETVYLFFLVTPPHLLVERAWKRGLEVGRYKAVDDTLAHAVEAYTGMPDLFFTWIRRSDKRIRFEFLDNTVPLGARPRTIAFGDNRTLNVLDVGRMLDLERFGRINVAAHSPQELYPDARVLAPERNLGFLERCVRGFERVRFARQGNGRVYLELECGRPRRVDRPVLEAAAADAEARVALMKVAGGGLGGAESVTCPLHLERNHGGVVTLGDWGYEAR